MSGTMMESEPVFKARCKSMGIADNYVKQLIDNDIKTMGKLAFVCGVQPGQADDKEFVDVMKTVLALDPIPVGTLSALRRLWFEANTMAIQDVTSRYEKTEATKNNSEI